MTVSTLMEPLRMPAEWEPQDGILLTFPSPDTDWEYMLPEIRNCYREILNTLITNNIHTFLIIKEEDCEYIGDIIESDFLHLLHADFNDTWIRDYGPITVESGGNLKALDFGFNAWGLKFAADKDNLVNLSLKEQEFFNPDVYRNLRSFILEGGSIESDGQGTILTTSQCLCSPNRNGGLSKKEVEKRLKEYLGASHVLWLDHGALEGDDTDSHIDTLARLCPNDTIVYTTAEGADESHRAGLSKMEAQLKEMRTPQGHPYRLIAVPLPRPIYDHEGMRLPATYCNYLVANGVVIVPTYGQSAVDMEAMQQIAKAFPDRKILSVDCRALICQHGSLHCATMQLPLGTINKNRH